ncbi:protein translocase subunit SecD [Nocardioides psychrotolerans]|uniref:Protein translocase subunit SecD n=1 Tax=Nocardioides psychrotolerans TaxID=1005945 RepID=A0A1I3KIZ6_9ACTN|nr:protein translocase subunit SecD [Nocardioides psychrotolerans]GEP38487.1 protein translocase subunit SecD [Nocardioides psychrotolerans]SFI72320.1 preprotein translocase subunit SecD [Nocardioides psychrotolerans]
MARKTARPGRTLLVFLMGVAISYGLVALSGTWKPELGLDLQGGTRITLTAIGDPSASSLDEARQIIDQRVNGSGVVEAEVTTQSGRFIVAEIPGDSRRDLVDTVQRQAQLRFRLVACSDFAPCGTGTVDPNQQFDPNQFVPQEGATGGATGGAGTGEGAGNGTANRPPLGYLTKSGGTTSPTPTEAPSDAASPSAAPTDSPSDSAGTEPSGSASPTESQAVVPQGDPALEAERLDEELAWMNNPDQASIDAFNAFQCPTDGSPPVVVDDPNQPLVTCERPDEDGQVVKYLLSKSVIEGTDLDSASAGIPQNEVNWVVNIDIGGIGEDVFAKVSNTLVSTGQQFAIVLDGQIISAPTMNGRIPNGQAEISGNFNEESATSLATSLKFGALPIAFQDDVTVETIGPSLAGNQLNAGLIAGGFGLGLVMLYCLLYYRGLGLVVLGSLAIAAVITYSMVLLLGVSAGFTLTLPGIAGLIIAVGITADSFIIFFERIRDEMRDGKTMRVAVESGWKRAKVTRLAANVVSLLSAFVLYFFATGAVKGFGFALGLSTLIDLAVLFWFTKPLVSWLGQFRFFNGGGRFSGLSTETLGMDVRVEGRV